MANTEQQDQYGPDAVACARCGRRTYGGSEEAFCVHCGDSLPWEREHKLAWKGGIPKERFRVLGQMLQEEGLRLATWEDTRPYRFTVACQACQQLTEFQPFSAIPACCPQCRLDLETTAPLFYVLLPKDDKH